MKILISLLLLGWTCGALPLMAVSSSNNSKKHRAHTAAERAGMGAPDVLPVQSKATNKTVTPSVTCISSRHRINTQHREGIDVSRYQQSIDWETVAAEGKISYAYIKATEGANLVDPYYSSNLLQARQAGISVGSYHFYRPRVSIEEQFANMTSVVKKHEQDLIPIIDIETTNGVRQDQFIADLREFLRQVTAHYGRAPMLYTYQNFYNKHLVGEFKGYHWMIAKYQTEAPILEEDVDYIMWQYTQTGRIPGIRGNVDRSRIMGNHTLHALQM